MRVLGALVLSTLAIACTGGDAEEVATESPSTPESVSVVVVSGTLDPSGDRLLRLQAKRHIRPAGPLPPSADGRYVLEVLFEGGDRLDLGFDGIVADDSGRTQHGFFEVTVPEAEPISSMTILDTSSGRTLAAIDGSEIER